MFLFFCFGCEDYEVSDALIVISGISVAIATIVVILVLYRIRKEPDPLCRIQEIKYSLSALAVGTLVWIVFESFDFENYYKNGFVQWGYFFEFGLMATFFFIVPFQIYKSFKFDNDKNSSKNRQNSFEQDMESEILRMAFKRHLVNEQAVENYYFWTEINQWKETFPQESVENRRKRFLFIFDAFIQSGSVLEINIGWLVKDPIVDLEKDLRDSEKEDPEIPITIFDSAFQEIYTGMIFGPYSRFKSKSSEHAYEVI